MGAVWNASYFGLYLQEDSNSQKKIALRTFLGYNTVEHLETQCCSRPGS
jgi:hypothetical protein